VLRYLYILLLLVPTQAFCNELFSSDSKDPIEILSDQLKITRSKNIAEFSGKVIATQTDTSLFADLLTVHYEQKNTEAKTTEAQKIKKIEFSGNVKIVTPSDTATSSKGDFIPRTGIFTLVDDVKLMQDNNILTGSKLVYNRITGESTLSSTKTNRVKAILVPKEKSDKKTGN